VETTYSFSKLSVRGAALELELELGLVLELEPVQELVLVPV